MHFLRVLGLAGLAYAAASDVVTNAVPDDECTKHLESVDVPLEGAVMFQMDKQAYKAEDTQISAEGKPDKDQPHHDVTEDAQTAGPQMSLLGLEPVDIVAKHGDKKCPCIGLQGLEGTNVIKFNETVSAIYPLEAGSSCRAWDDGIHPDCRPSGRYGIGEGMCARSWCFVDPCDCDLEIWPAKATHFVPVTFRKKPLYFSYETCSGVDVPGEVMPEPISEEQCEQEVDTKYGNPNCSCIGFDNLGSDSTVFKGNTPSFYPGNVGSSCQAWDQMYDQEHCKKASMPLEWCSQPYCFVDPCSCSLQTAPSIFLWGVKWKGHPVHYSYEACGGKDLYSSTWNAHAKIQCESYSFRWWCEYHEECGWNGTHCMDTGKLYCVDAFRDSGAPFRHALGVPMVVSLLLAWL